MDTALSPPVGQLLGGRYHVGSRIARGGMATVYLGTDTRLDRVVALKIAHPDLSEDADFVRRFIGEARSAARLSSPNVVAIYDQGSDGRLHYIAMEYVPGRTLRQLLNERGRLTARESLDIMTGVLSGLAAAHQAGFAHRDVKPENVLLTAAGDVKVADFGLARSVAGAVQTKGGMIIGTAAYLAPEQVSGGNSDARTDVYAAGVMLFELLTGGQPHIGESPLAVAYKHVNEIVPPPSTILPGLAPALDALVAMATSRDPDLRPANAGQFLRAIQEVRTGHALPGTAPYVAPGSTGPGTVQYPAAYSTPYPYEGGSPRGGHAEGDTDPHSGAYSGAHSAGAGARGDGTGGSGSHSGAHTGAHAYRPEPGRGDSVPPLNADAARFAPAPWETESGAVGASALPSLSPQSAAIAPIIPGLPSDPHAAVNHTLIVPAVGDHDDYFRQPGHRNGDGYAGSGYAGAGYGGAAYDQHRGRRRTSQRSEPWLQKWLFSRRLIYLSVGLVLVAVIALAGWWLSSGQYTKIPQLRGLTETAAKADLTNLGLHQKLGKPVHNPLPKGEVISTSPGVGARIRRGSVVGLIVSLGPILIQVPDVSGQPLSQAQSALKAAHLAPGAVTKTVSSSVPVGDVISTTPAAYTVWPQTKPVGLTVSAGPGLANFVGQQVSAAQAAAQAGGYTINPVANATGSEPANTITSQSPPPNTPITPGEVVTVRYSPGPPSVPVPDVKGMPLQQAITTLQQAGFQVTVNHQGPGGTVGSYSPQGSQPKGTTITVNVGFFSGL